jgi:ferrous iron transport protein B
MQKERGWRVSIGIFVLVTGLAFSVGWLLNQLLQTSGFLA